MTQTPSSGNGATPDTGLSATDTTSGTDATSGTKLPQSIDDALKQIESLQAALKAANKESASHRHKLKGFEEAEAARQQAQMSEQEKLQKQLADLQAAHDEAQRQLEEDRNYATLERTGRTLGITDPTALDDAVKLALIELATSDDDDPDPKEAMKKIIANRPWLTGRTTSTSGGATNPSRTQSSQVGEITMGNLSEAMSRYNELSQAQKEQVQRLLINRR